ncbi:hypothetical protein ACFQY3_03530 [Paenibacillus farraposensis]|uniref:hypothetical protein n=1 Tax=Paenibacillus farraposensis TaxID=2807095 RepID=UPI00360856F1
MGTKLNVVIIALLLIIQSFFGAILAYADTSAPELPQSTVGDPAHTTTDDVYDAPNPEPPIEAPLPLRTLSSRPLQALSLRPNPLHRAY